MSGNKTFKQTFIQNSMFLIFVFSILSCTSKKENTIFNCENLKLSDSISFHKNKIEFETFDSVCNLKKVKDKIVIPNTNIVFKDSLDSEVFSHRILGENKERNWISIISQGPLQNYYYLYNKNNNKLDTLIGEPKIFDNKILSIEDQYTDYQEIIQVWDISKNGIIKKKLEFSINKCKESRIIDSYIKNGKIFIKCGDFEKKYYTIELEKIQPN